MSVKAMTAVWEDSEASGNDLVVLHTGAIYATDPFETAGNSKVYYVSPKGEKKVVDTGLKFANGITVSPDQTLLYVADSRTHWVYSYQIRADGSLAMAWRLGIVERVEGRAQLLTQWPPAGAAQLMRVRLLHHPRCHVGRASWMRGGPAAGEAARRQIEAAPVELRRADLANEPCGERREQLVGPEEPLPEGPSVVRFVRRMDLVLVERENQVVRIGEAELYAIRRVELLARYARAVDEDAVAALQILNVVLARFDRDAGVIAGGAIVAKNQVIVRMPSDVEWQRLNRNTASRSGRIGDYESCGPGRRPGGCGGHQELRCRAGASGDTAARNSCARSRWQCEQ